jgi:DNA-damage-inducible protein J
MTAVATSLVKAQVDSSLKLQAEATLRALGLDMSSAVRMFLSQVVLRGAIPFDVALPMPNKLTLAAIEDSYAGRVQAAGSVDELFDSLDE